MMFINFMERINRIKISIVFICMLPGGMINTVVAAGVYSEFCNIIMWFGIRRANITFWSNLNY